VNVPHPTRLAAFRFVPLFALAGLVTGGSDSCARPAGWPPVTDGDVVRDGVHVQATRTMTLELPASADAAFPLFGPVREAEWSPGWTPQFVAPTAPAQGTGGAVFTTPGPAGPLLWVMTDYDEAQRVLRYVHVRPGAVVAQLWIVVRSISARRSAADVTFRTTALGPEGGAALAHFVEAFPGFKSHWEGAIGPVLAAGAAAERRPH
jgi:hypothetical protein